MISISPEGEIYLCKTPLENDYKNQLTFSNLTSQYEYFASKIFKTLDNYTYIKKDNIIKVGFPIDEIIGCNYLFYKNIGFSNKWYYCFITNMEYVNENCTSITFETDVWQTYQFDIIYNPCFVEREHVNDDTIGLHTVPENVETGDYIVNYENKCNLLTSKSFILASNVDPVKNNQGNYPFASVRGGIYNGLMHSFKYYYFQDTSTTELPDVIKAANDQGKAESILSIFVAPTFFFDKDDETITDNGKVKETYSVKICDWEQNGGNAPTKLTTINGYTPKNNKLFTFPYCYLRMTNNNGNDAIYHFERFANNNQNKCYFQFLSSICPGMSIILYPNSYDGITNNYNESLQAGKFPICGWSNDTYINWLTQNGINIATNLVGNALSIAGGGASVVTGNAMGATSVMSGIAGIANTVGSIYQHKLNPIQSAGNTNTGDVKTSGNLNTFTAYGMSIKREYARIIDNYFSAYGYHVNEFKVPNITGRQNWNFVKTIECNFEGDIPQDHLQIIKQMFNNGITLWHNPNTMYNYNASNNII